MFVCNICHQKFSDSFTHFMGDKGFGAVDEAHAEAERRLAKNDYDSPCPLCGSKIDKYYYGNGEEVSWEFSCSGCGFLWDED